MSEMGEGDSDGEFFSRRPSYQRRRRYSPQRDKVQYNYKFETSSEDEDDDRPRSKPRRRKHFHQSVPEPPPFIKRVIYNQIEGNKTMTHQQPPPIIMPTNMLMSNPIGSVQMSNPMGPNPIQMSHMPGPGPLHVGPMPNQMGPGPIPMGPMGMPGQMNSMPNQMNPLGMPIQNHMGPMGMPMPNQMGPVAMPMPSQMGPMGLPMQNQMGFPNQVNLGMPMINQMGPMCMPPMAMPTNQMNMMYPNPMMVPPMNVAPLNPIQMQMPMPMAMPNRPKCPPRGHFHQNHRYQRPISPRTEEPNPHAVISKPPMLKTEHRKVPTPSPREEKKRTDDSDSETSNEAADPVGFKNDGSFLEIFKKMNEKTENEETTDIKKECDDNKSLPKFTPSFVGKRRGGRILKTGLVKKVKKIDSTENSDLQDPWSIYMAEVKKYRETNCEEEGKTRALVK